MSEAATESSDTSARGTTDAETGSQSTEDSTDWKAESRKWEQRAKENGTKAKEFDQQRKAAMTDAERAVTEAEERGRTAAASEFGRELALERFDALAGRRNPDFNTAQALEYVDLAKFLGEDGRPDVKAITAAVERLVPAPADGPPSFDGGTRTPPPAQQGMSGLIRKAAGRA
ncbi:MAG: hypothetical protein H0X12_04955 [Nocardioides sp.]|nr:hypothetical protein [Nocardioides sp.]